LWVLLGNARSDVSQYASAFEAYATALSCDNDLYHRVMINANWAHALLRAKRFQEAVARVATYADNLSSDQISGELREFAESVRTRALQRASPKPRRSSRRRRP
jgi:hypothetical protein